MSLKIFGKDYKELDDLDIDDLLSKLTPEELEELSNDVDPDNSLLPPSQRCRDQTKKAPTGPLNRRQLLAYIEKKAREEKDWDEAKPYSKETRGKIWKPKEVPPPPPDDEDITVDLGDEYEQALETATEEELVDLAGVLGLHGMLNQVQFYNSILNKKQGGEGGSRFESVVKPDMLKVLPLEPDNNTDVDKSIEQLKDDDSDLTSLNLNNIKNISVEKYKDLCEALKANTCLETLSLANTRMTDVIAKSLVEALEKNTSITSVNVESNFITGELIRDLIKAIVKHQSVTEFKAANQRAAVLGNQVEMEIAKLVEENKKLLRLGLSFEVADARIRIHEALQRNNDNLRLKRIGQD